MKDLSWYTHLPVRPVFSRQAILLFIRNQKACEAESKEQYRRDIHLTYTTISHPTKHNQNANSQVCRHPSPVNKNPSLWLSLAYRRAEKSLRKQLQESSIIMSEVIEFAAMDDQLDAIEMGLEDPRVLCAHHGEEEDLWFEKQSATV